MSNNSNNDSVNNKDINTKNSSTDIGIDFTDDENNNGSCCHMCGLFAKESLIEPPKPPSFSPVPPYTPVPPQTTQPTQSPPDIPQEYNENIVHYTAFHTTLNTLIRIPHLPVNSLFDLMRGIPLLSSRLRDPHFHVQFLMECIQNSFYERCIQYIEYLIAKEKFTIDTLLRCDRYALLEAFIVYNDGNIVPYLTNAYSQLSQNDILYSTVFFCAKHGKIDILEGQVRRVKESLVRMLVQNEYAVPLIAAERGHFAVFRFIMNLIATTLGPRDVERLLRAQGMSAIKHIIQHREYELLKQTIIGPWSTLSPVDTLEEDKAFIQCVVDICMTTKGGREALETLNGLYNLRAYIKKENVEGYITKILEEGDLDTLDYLLEMHKEACRKAFMRHQAALLLKGIRLKGLECLVMVFRAFPDLRKHFIKSRGYSIYHYFCEEGNIGGVKYLFRSMEEEEELGNVDGRDKVGGKISKRDKMIRYRDFRGFRLACREGHSDVVKEHLRHFPEDIRLAMVEAKNCFSIWESLRYGYIDTMRVLGVFVPKYVDMVKDLGDLGEKSCENVLGLEGKDYLDKVKKELRNDENGGNNAEEEMEEMEEVEEKGNRRKGKMKKEGKGKNDGADEMDMKIDTEGGKEKERSDVKVTRKIKIKDRRSKN